MDVRDGELERTFFWLRSLHYPYQRALRVTADEFGLPIRVVRQLVTKGVD